MSVCRETLICLSFFAGGLILPAKADAQLAEQLLPLIEAHRGEVAVSVRHLVTGEEYHWRADTAQPTASLIKLAVMVTAYRQADAGRLNLQQMISLTEADKVPGSGILTDHFSPGAMISVQDAIRLMIRYSDNTATNLVVGKIGLSKTAEMMQELGFPNTKLHSLVYRGDTSVFPERSRQFGLGSTTARETVELLTRLHVGGIAGEGSCKAMLDHLLQCDDDTKIGANLPPGIKYANKSGAVAASRTDCGIIFAPQGAIAICVLTTSNQDKSWKDDNSANRLCAEIGRIVFDHFNPAAVPAESSDSQPLQLGASGDMVETLQRTLNVRMNPSPGLAIDGDFGPVTETAVRRFQETNSLPVTGVFDAASWKSLGPVAAAELIPDPEVINTAALPLEPAETTDGPPIVTCRAWTIVDAQSGNVLWSHNADAALDIASTTKIMTVWLVVRLAEHQPQILDETLTMSERADQTVGSTSGLRAGERVSIREALYGLMLPSGNDMSVALAEHFGQRMAEGLPAPDDSPLETDPLVLFVRAMNAEAERLEMVNTHYQNPHGLTAADHQASASDLALLARTALSSELFQHYVATRQRGATVEGAQGYLRNVRWENTNQLLKFEGYSGVKTGTTQKAGACLVSTAERDGRRLLLVVLGSAASESRYADSRNLYRWAWQQLQTAP